MRRKKRVRPGDVYVTCRGRFSSGTTFNASYGCGHESPNSVLIDFPDGTMCTVITTVRKMRRILKDVVEEWCMFLVDGRVCYRFVDPLQEEDHGLRRVTL